jgi:sugar O-acyltransferase (sialic acid O-acetyltransferase NeuD family)
VKPLVLFGAAEIAEVAHFYFTHDSEWQVKAFTVDAGYLRDTTFCGLPVVAHEEVSSAFPPESHAMFIAVSYSKVNTLRAEKYAEAKRRGYQLATYVSSKATVWPGLSVGDNCFVLEDNTIQPFATIGSNVTLWSGNHIGHHSSIGDHCFIASHVVISGGVTVGEYSFIGVNATLRDHVKIGKRCVIGAGSLIQQDVPDLGVCIQQPAELSRVPSNRLRRI